MLHSGKMVMVVVVVVVLVIVEVVQGTKKRKAIVNMKIEDIS